jgi:hypothetical protein
LIAEIDDDLRTAANALNMGKTRTWPFEENIT